MDARDGDFRTDSKLKIRVSSRIGRNEKYTAHNVGFRCVQSVDEADLEYFHKSLDGEPFRVVKLRPPVHHRASGANPEARHEEILNKRKIVYKSEL